MLKPSKSYKKSLVNWSKNTFPTTALALVLVANFLNPIGLFPIQELASPTLLAPADRSTITATGYNSSLEEPPIAIPEFSWSAIAGATNYRLQFSQDIGFTTNIREFTTPLTHYLPPLANQMTDGLWYWRVRVESPTVGDYSLPYSFTKSWATPDNIPQLDLPTDNSSLEFFDSPVFSWQPVIGAARYLFQISQDPDFINIAYSNYTLRTTHQPTYKLQNGTYYWRVTPLDPAEHEGVHSDTRMFIMNYNQVPQLLEPADNSHPTYTPTFRWTAVRGAQYYRLQYSTDPSFNTSVTTIDIRNTTYTPGNTLPNDVNYYWRVRAHSGNSISDWSERRSFLKQWYIQAQPLTPVNLYQDARFPLFSWTPVQAASYYRIEINTTNTFPGGLEATTANTFYSPENYDSLLGTRYWRVTPYDRNGYAGKPSVVFSYISSGTKLSPTQVYPLYYYTPRSDLNPHEDRTIPVPIFVWQQVTTPPFVGGRYSSAYRLQVSKDSLFHTVDWSVDTEGLSATPTVANPFTPEPNVNYFWRVRPLTNIGGAELGQWSQTWKTRIDLSQGLSQISNQPPKLLRPARDTEWVERTPLFEWWPVAGADSYRVEISSQADFDPTYLIDSADVPYPAYSPLESLAQRNLNKLNYGTFYWRVQAYKEGSPLYDWSETWRFQVASQSEWIRHRALGQPENKLSIGADPSGDIADPKYDLTGLYASQDADFWYFGFNTATTTGEGTYRIYIDMDHKDGSGATEDLLGNPISIIEAHLPEFIIDIIDTNGEYFADQVYVYEWTGSDWSPPQSLEAIGGDIFPADLYAVALTASNSGWAAGQYGDILRLYNGSWSQNLSPTFDSIRGMSFLDPNTGWAVTDNGSTLRWNWQTAQWDNLSRPTDKPLYSVSIVAGNKAWAAGGNGTLLYWNGAGWGGLNSKTSYDLYGIDVITSTVQYTRTEGWVVGQFGTVVHWDGTDWKNPANLFLANLNSVSMVNDNNVWAVGDTGKIIRWNGSNWGSVSSPTSYNLHSVFMLSASSGWAVGDHGTILRWNGSNWSVVSSPTQLNLYAVTAFSSNSALIVGENGANLMWNGSSWTPINKPITDYIELRVPNTAIGMQEETGSYALSLISLPSAGGSPQDSVPSDPGVPGGGLLSRFASVSERMSLVMPPNNVEGDPTTFASIPPFFWDYPTGSSGTTPWAGAWMKAYLDPQYTSEAADYVLTSNAPYYANVVHAWNKDFLGDNSYYWRIRPRYQDSFGQYFGAWSEGLRFERAGFTPQNLQESVTFSTPTFSWDRVEGAESYDLEVDNDPNFGSPEISVNTAQVSYTFEGTLGNGTYNWHVRVRRNGGITNEWSDSKQFTLTLPTPTNLTPNDPLADNVLGYAPTFCWDPVLKLDPDNQPVLAAYRYRLQVSKGDPTFSTNYETVETEQTCWTPTMGYDDGKYYWRVAMIDGNGRLGDYSAAAEFTKQYPITQLLSPKDNQILLETPTFSWSRVNEATSYKLEISQNPTFSPLYDGAVTNNTSYVPSRIYDLDHTYYWRVAILDHDGKIGPFNDAIVILGTPPGGTLLYLPLVTR